MTIDPKLRPEGWAPHYGSRVVLLPDPAAAPDDPPPPAGVWTVIDRAPEATHWWVQAHDGEARTWAVVQRAGRAKDSMPTGWPLLSVSSRRLFPAALLQRTLPC